MSDTIVLILNCAGIAIWSINFTVGMPQWWLRAIGVICLIVNSMAVASLCHV